MMDRPPLPPHLEQFVHELLAAAQLLTAAAPPPPVGPREGTGAGVSRPAPAALPERWEPVGAGAATAPARRCPRGLLADLRSGLDYDDFADARAEMWAGQDRGDAR